MYRRILDKGTFERSLRSLGSRAGFLAWIGTMADESLAWGSKLGNRATPHTMQGRPGKALPSRKDSSVSTVSNESVHLLDGASHLTFRNIIAAISTLRSHRPANQTHPGFIRVSSASGIQPSHRPTRFRVWGSARALLRAKRVARCLLRGQGGRGRALTTISSHTFRRGRGALLLPSTVGRVHFASFLGSSIFVVREWSSAHHVCLYL